MEIVRIEDYKKNRKLVYLEEDTPAFCLYSKEISQFGLKEGEELSEEVHGRIKELLSKRARERALYLLDDMARTERQIRDRLKEGMYPDEAVEYAVAYCRRKHYIDDGDYARRYITLKAGTYSKRMIEKKLLEKGIDRDTVSEALEELDVSEAETLRELIRKKYGDISDISFEERQKIMRRFLSSGFSYDSVREAMDQATV